MCVRVLPTGVNVVSLFLLLDVCLGSSPILPLEGNRLAKVLNHDKGGSSKLHALTSALLAIQPLTSLQIPRLDSSNGAILVGRPHINTPSMGNARQISRRSGSATMVFESYNEDSIRSIMQADNERKDFFKAKKVSTGMLLIGLSEVKGIASKVLRELDLDTLKIRKAVAAERESNPDSNRGDGMNDNKDEKNQFDDDVQLIIKEGCFKAREKLADSTKIEPHHLLHAAVSDSTSEASRALKRLRIDTDNLIKLIEDRSKTVETVGGGPSTSAKGEKTLDEYATDLTKQAADGKFDPVIGRDEELSNMILTLARRKKNNAVLVGEPGVGKTAIAEGLAQRIVDGQVPERLKNKRVLLLDVPGMLAGSKYRGEFEERMQNVLSEVKASDGQIILMIDEIHTIVGAGATEGGSLDAGNMLKPMLANGELQLIGATTLDEYRKFIEKDKALERRFSMIDVKEPTVDESIQILKGVQQKYAEHHNLRYTPEALEACVKYAAEYIADRFLPDKAIDVLDETGAAIRIQVETDLPEDIKSELQDLESKKIQAVKDSDYETAEKLKQEIAAINEKVDEVVPMVEEQDIASIVSKATGIPISKVTTNETLRLLSLEDTLHKRVVGQHEAITAIAKAVRRARSGLKDKDRPIASFIFAGPTGVGKTELCKALAESYYGNEKSIIRLDMSEYMERHTVSKLIGSPAGYVGYGEETQLTDPVRRNPYSVLLFDEIEKAHPDVFNIMLQMLEDGRVTDSKGRVVSFKNTLIIMTSNVGAQGIEKNIEGGGGFGFSVESSEGDATYDNLKKTLMDELKNQFKPEFINRLDDTIVFKPLTRDEVKEIAELEFNKVYKRFAETTNATLGLSDAMKERILQDGFDPKFGARPLRRAVSKLLEDALATSILENEAAPEEVVIVDVDDDGNVVVLRNQKMPNEGSFVGRLLGKML